jgi:alpha-1,2-mannosyltransferase
MPLPALPARPPWRLAAGIAIACAGLLLAAWLGVRMAPALRAGALFFNDSSAQWSFARFAMELPAAGLYDGAALFDFQRSLYPPLRHTFPYPYPPHYLFAVWPLGWLDPHWVWPVWSGATLALFLLAAGWRQPWEAALLAVAPASIVALAYGQNGFLTSALILGGLRLLPERQVLAGVLLGLATIKPQLGLLIPVALLAAGQYRALFAAAATVGAMVALSALAFGWETWPLFLESVTGHAAAIDGWVSDYRRATLAANLTLAGLPRGIAYVVQWGLAAAMAALVWRSFRRGISSARIALLIVAGYAATPYAFLYDLPMLAAAVLILARGRNLPWREAAILAAGLLFPLAAVMTSRFYWMTGASLIALLALAWWRQKQESSFSEEKEAKRLSSICSAAATQPNE